MSDQDDEEDFYMPEADFTDGLTHTVTDPINVQELHANSNAPQKSRRVKFAESNLSISINSITGGTPGCRSK